MTNMTCAAPTQPISSRPFAWRWLSLAVAALVIGSGCAATTDDSQDDDESIAATEDGLTSNPSQAQCDSACSKKGFKCGGKWTKTGGKNVCFCSYGSKGGRACAPSVDGGTRPDGGGRVDGGRLSDGGASLADEDIEESGEE